MTIKGAIGDDYLSVFITDTYGGQTLSVTHTEHFKILVKWLENFKIDEERERLLRETNPEVKLAYDAYKMAVAMHS